MQVVVIEANEIPLRLLEWYAGREPASTVARLLSTAQVGETIVKDEPMRGLYPSQTWATLGTGVPFEKHGIYWYGDPKPVDLPFYWQVAARHRRVGVFGSLHSSPMSEQANEPGFSFYVPDVFGDDEDVLPHRLAPLHRFNLRMTRDNGRAVASAAPLADYVDGLRALRGSGVRPRTVASLAKLATAVATGSASRERLRTAQFLLLADAFMSQLDDSRPDLAVFFTNHVAASMHRYWPASFPTDWEEPPYDEDWVGRFEAEIPAALMALDRFLERVWAWCSANERALVIVSSMGQVGGGEVDTGDDRTLVVDDQRRFLAALGVADTAPIRSSMVPHITFVAEDDAAARAEQERLASLPIAGTMLEVDRSGNAVTITYRLDDASDRIEIGDESHPVGDVGLKWVEVNEFKSGVHDARGTLIVANSAQAALSADPVDSIEFAPALLRMLGVEVLGHHVEPSFRLA